MLTKYYFFVSSDHNVIIKFRISYITWDNVMSSLTKDIQICYEILIFLHIYILIFVKIKSITMGPGTSRTMVAKVV